VQEALASLVSTGYLERDGRGGSQGYTYALVRDPEGMSLGISLDPLPGEAVDAEQTRGSRGIAREGARAIEGLNLQEDPAIARSRDGESNGQPREEARKSREKGTVRHRPIELAERKILDQGEEFCLYGEEQKGKPDGIKLAELGWARRLGGTVDDATAPTETMAGDGVDVNADPVARYTAAFEIGSVLAMTATEIFQHGGRVLSKGEQIPPDWPSDPQDVHERLTRLAPVLPITNRDHPYFEGDWYPCDEPPEVRDGYTHVEYWEGDDDGKEGIWVFAIHEPGQPVDRDEVVSYVWAGAKRLEKVVENVLELPSTWDLSS
jgi:hypothetical protein